MNQQKIKLDEVRLPLISASQAAALDRSEKGDSIRKGYTLMEEAGEAIYKKIQLFRTNHPSVAQKPVLIFTGGGNNGGDGFVAARLLLKNKVPYRVYGLVDPIHFKNEAFLAYHDFIQAGGFFSFIQDVDSLEMDSSSGCLVVDTLLGIGAVGELRPRFAKLVEKLNLLEIPILAVDSPTIPLIATETLMLGNPRREAFDSTLASFYGKVTVAPLSYQKSLIQEITAGDYWISDSDFLKLLPSRNEFGDKRAQGTGLIISGSSGMTGAPTLAALAALRSGIGLLSMAVPSSILQTLSIKLNEPVFYALEDHQQGSFLTEHLESIKALFKYQKAVCIGPGLSQKPELKKLVSLLLPAFTSPVILDADALNALDGNPDLLLSLNVDAILSPHVREWERLFGALPSKMEEILKTIKEKAVQYKVTLVLKGFPTYIASKDGGVYVIGKANSGLAKGGSGDVLAGIILALLAQGLSTLEAAILGTWIHVEAGQRTRKQLGVFSMLPSDLIDSLSSVFMGKTDL